MTVIAVISIPSASAPPPAVHFAPKASQPPPASSASADDSHSFASFLKSSRNQQAEEEPEQGSTSPKPSVEGKDKAEKDTKKNGDSKKSSLIAEMGSMPVPGVMVPNPEAKPFSLSWPVAATESKAGEGSANTDNAGTPAADVTEALKTSGTETLAKAPVAFGVTLSKVEGAKAQVSSANSKPAAASTEAAFGKTAAGEALKTVESKSPSGKQQHSHSSHEDQPLSQSSKDVKASATSPKLQTESFSAVQQAPSTGQVSSVAATTVQNAYTPAQQHSTVDKTAPAAPVASVAEPVQTPTVRSQNIDLKIAGADNREVDVRVSQRAGDVQVTVRTPDGELAQSLRQHLPELSDRLSQAGASGELWQPPQAQSANTGGNNAESRYSDDAQTQQQQQNQQQHSRGNPHGGGQQQERETAESVWLNELNQAEKGKH
jgi:Flagellar hook-length control protein FliK